MTTAEWIAVILAAALFDVAHGACRAMSRTRSMMLGPLGLLAYAWVRARGWRW